ncbi:Anti-sigma-B factor antagonist [Actinoplanes sp. SE50]|uniref:STAS domain-containing protein n=1 Tax=unclassified Actinoplanes TaxID=2626549 RepID=UPI00023ED683|nr:MULTISPECIES: STAS domain-containing protein [unclassified Actinoplanes]AEV86792.1 Anti-sigma-B factor antagonist [Actinoplanes sp. SE50/110]ATO85189.1 Anti-sigma-B factor antagonist [Actinoplanes sp. SE50]SLM02599.1 anti-sigma B factor antagonist [Actinoplanes sp. SE50/110]
MVNHEVMQMAATALQVETVASRRGIQVRVAGELDLATAGILGVALAEALAAGVGHIDLDLADVSFLDCAGLRTLERAVTASGKRLRLVAASATVCWMLRIAGMQWHLDTAACERQSGCPGPLNPAGHLEIPQGPPEPEV